MKKLWASFLLASMVTLYSCSTNNNALDDRKKIVIIIDDMGRHPDVTKEISAIDSDITLAFLPYVSNLEVQTKTAHENGNEIMLHMPMDAHGEKWNAEQNMLKRSMGNDKIRWWFHRALCSSPHFSGVNNHLGSAFTERADKMAVLMSILKEDYSDLYFIDSRTSSHSVAERVAKDFGIRSGSNNVFIDNEQSVPYTLRMLFDAQSRAEKNGYAIAIGHPHKSTRQALREWTAHLDKTAFDIVPASAVVTLD